MQNGEKKMLYYVDRIEGDSAVMDNDSGERTVVSLSLLPEGIRDGSVVREMPDGTFAADMKAEAERRKAMSERFNRLKNRNKK